MGVDVLRKGYTVEVRPFFDSDITTLIRWYKCAPGAKCLPFHTIFGSTVYDYNKTDPDPPQGEIKASRNFQQRDTNVSGLKGQCYIGTPDMFARGVSIKDAGEPHWTGCCSPIIIPSGGAVIGGSAILSSDDVQIGYGGVLAYGNAIAAGVFSPVSSGGVLAAGNATITLISAPTTSGGVWANGTSPGLTEITGLTVTPGDSSANVGFNPESGVSSYNIYTSSTSATGPWTLCANTTSTSYTVSGLTNGSTYYITVAPVLNGVVGPLLDGIAVVPTGNIGGLLGAGAASISVLTTGCSNCSSGASAQFSFTLSGIANSSCADCSSLNKTFTLSHTTGCSWESGLFTVCGNSTAVWDLLLTGVSGQRVQLTCSVLEVGYAHTNSTTWDCQSAITLTLGSSGVGCSGWPSTITLTPV